ncbi:MAG: DUF305 domain-containing protein [Ilumatobacteraceae bacterium]|nr:DUF305 domain-containing protein [Ilumatobacteraceae bacterium]
MNRTRILFSSLTVLALLTGCAGSSVADIAETAVDTAQSAIDFNESDVMFAQMMIPHHEQAIEMSDIALDPTVGASDVVKSLATRIKGAQDPEIVTMKAFLTSWKMSLTPDSSMNHSDMMSGMLSAKDITQLSSLRGTEFDRAWITGMIAHHEGAITMAKDVLKDGTNSAVRTLATAVETAQDAEILEMKELLG